MLKIVFMAIQNSILPGLAVTIIVLSATGIGIMLLKLTKLKDCLPDMTEVPIGMALGLGVFGYVADLLYMMQIIDMRVFLLLLILAGLVCFGFSFKYIKVLLASRSTGISQHTTKLDYVYRICGWFIVAIFCLGLYIHNVTPVSDNDSVVHYAFLSKMIAGGIPFDEMLLLRNMPITDLNRLIPMIYASGYLLMGTSAAHLMNFVFILTILLLIHLFCVYHAKAIGLWDPLAILISLSIGELTFSGPMAKVDYGVAMLIVASLLALVTYRSRSLWILPAFFGLSICSRTNSIYMVLVMLVIFLVVKIWDNAAEESRVKSKTIFQAVKAIAFVGLGTFFFASPPYLLHYFIYGNPIFPFRNAIFGHYEHPYDWIVFNFIRYKVKGIFAPIAIYAQLLVKPFMGFLPGDRAALGYGLSPIFILVPFAIDKRRQYMIPFMFFILGYLVWAVYSSHTHRSLLGVAFIGAILIVGVIRKFRSIKIIYFLLSIFVLWSAWGVVHKISVKQLTKRTNINSYFLGIIDKDIFYQEEIKPKLGYYSPDTDDIKIIKKITNGDNVACIKVYPQLHPDFINVFRLDVPTEDMETCYDREDLDEVDRHYLKICLFDPHLQIRYAQLSETIWPADGSLKKPMTRTQVWRLARLVYDSLYYMKESILKRPKNIINVMKLHHSKYLLKRKAGDSLDVSSVDGLELVWQSKGVELFKISDELAVR